MDEIISSIPCSCDGSWYLEHYSIHDDGYSCDGDTVDESDVPDFKQELEAWNSYFQHVVETGKDPLGEFNLPDSGTKTRKWQARIRNWIGASAHGLKVSGVRRRGRGPFIAPSKAPKEVREYLLLTDRDCIEDDDLRTIDSIVEQCNNDDSKAFKVNAIEARVNFPVDEPRQPWSEDRRQLWRKRKARKSIK